MTGPGIYRAQVDIRKADGQRYETPIQPEILTQGAVSATWHGGDMRRPYIEVRPSAPGNMTVTVRIGNKSSALAIEALAVSASAIHFSSGSGCLLSTEGTPWCWGGNLGGALGAVTMAQCNGAFCQYGGQDGNETPLRSSSTITFQQIATAGFVCVFGSRPAQACARNCGIDAENQVHCFGRGVLIGFKLKSIDIRPPSFNYTSDEEACGIALDDTARCFRFIGNQNSQSVDIGNGMKFRTIAVGRYHTCGIDMAGGAWCWGDNRFGQLGNGQVETVKHATPQRVIGNLEFTQIDLGDQSTCGLDTAGTIQCWGRGAGTDGGILPTSCPDSSKCIAVPTPLPGGRTYTAFSRNNIASVCGRTAGGTVDCWTGFEGAPIVAPVPVALSSVSVGRSLDVTGLGVSFPYYACGVGTDATVYCWNDTTSFKIGR
jgi:hypothetical protein